MAEHKEASMPNDDTISDFILKEAADGRQPFVLNIVHHHHEHVAIVNEPTPNIFDMMTQFQAMRMIGDMFATTPMLGGNAPKALPESTMESSIKEKAISSKLYDIQAEYEIIPDEVVSLDHSFITPTFNPNYNGREFYKVLRKSFTPTWKEEVRRLNIDTPFVLIELCKVNDEEPNVVSTYLTLYGAKPIFSKSMYNKNNSKQTIPLDWEVAPYFVEALKEAQHLSGKKFFYYVEELELDGKKEEDVILSNDFPKSEVYEHISLFNFKPKKVYTNFQRNIFQIHPDVDGYTITRV